MCDVGYYGQHENCEQCDPGQTTDTTGSTDQSACKCLNKCYIMQDCNQILSISRNKCNGKDIYKKIF